MEDHSCSVKLHPPVDGRCEAVENAGSEAQRARILIPEAELGGFGEVVDVYRFVSLTEHGWVEDEQAMHMLIRVLTPGRSPDDALGRARGALDHLVGIGEYATPVFDYYRTMNDTAARFRDHPRYGQLDAVLSLESETGKQMLEDAVDAQEHWFVDTLAELREKLDVLDPTEVMTDVDLARFDCYRLGQFAGPSVWVYDDHGAGLRSRSAVDEYVERHDDDELWIVPADVHY